MFIHVFLTCSRQFRLGLGLPQASMVYITSFVLTSQPRIAAAEALAKSALRNSTSRTRLCLNLSSAGLLRRVKDSLLQLLPECSFLFGNCGELRAFAALMGWTAIAATASESDLDQLELIKRLAAMLKPGGMAVITAGAEPTMVATGDGYAQCFPVPLSLRHNMKIHEVSWINMECRVLRKASYWLLVDILQFHRLNTSFQKVLYCDIKRIKS